MAKDGDTASRVAPRTDGQFWRELRADFVKLDRSYHEMHAVTRPFSWDESGDLFWYLILPDSILHKKEDEGDIQADRMRRLFQDVGERAALGLGFTGPNGWQAWLDHLKLKGRNLHREDHGAMSESGPINYEIVRIENVFAASADECYQKITECLTESRRPASRQPTPSVRKSQAKPAGAQTNVSDLNKSAARRSRFKPVSRQILKLLIDLKLVTRDGKLRQSEEDLERFAEAAQRQKVPTPASWSWGWLRTLEHDKRKLGSYLNSLVVRARKSGFLTELIESKR